ncbi:MAG: serine hydrolase [Gemmatimonadales bacterium]
MTTASLLVCAAAGAQERQSLPDDVRTNIQARLAAGWTPSIVVGLVDSGGARFFSFGTVSPEGGPAVNERTIYEIGSMTKVFTALTLADMAVRHEVGLDDPAGRYLPDSVRMPGPADTPITLALLASQRSGLPRLPANLVPADSTNPYADYDAARLYAYLNGAGLSRAPGSRYEYSNLGFGLLGFLLARRAGTGYEQLIQDRILRPLDMAETTVTLSAEARTRLATGSVDGHPVSNWDFDALAGAGALRSDARDLTRFLSAALGLVSTPLDSAFALAERPRADAGSPAMKMGLGWHILVRPDRNIVWHNGGTGGYHSWAGYDRARQTGAVVLTNSPENIDDIGFHLLDPSIPMNPVRAAITLPAGELEEYVGTYPLTPAFAITIRREGDQLTGQATGQGAFRLYPSARDEFFLKVVDARISFTRDEAGQVNGLILHQGGADQRAPRQAE